MHAQEAIRDPFFQSTLTNGGREWIYLLLFPPTNGGKEWIYLLPFPPTIGQKMPFLKGVMDSLLSMHANSQPNWTTFD